jgi:hypothetical protein
LFGPSRRARRLRRRYVQPLTAIIIPLWTCDLPVPDVDGHLPPSFLAGLQNAESNNLAS